ncbi:MAG: FAD-binding protein [Lachnospiraceae bacterium]|nr:FAD-binding protein [Lachnospiraceae bacterium]
MNGREGTPRTKELPRPEKVNCPHEEAYQADVVVIGCGFAGLNAAVSAKEAGQTVLVIDKGKPGYSGLSPWPSSFRWFDPERGDDEEAFKEAMIRGGDYLCNLRWYDCWLKESKGIYERLSKWGILAQYPKASEAGDYYEQEDFTGYRELFDKFDRHKKWIEVLDQYEIPYLEHTMVTDLLTCPEASRPQNLEEKDFGSVEPAGGRAENMTAMEVPPYSVQRRDDSPMSAHFVKGESGDAQEKICGVLGFHVPSGQVITVQAKAVVMATGGGSYKPTGYPVGGDTFDGEYMAWELGLPIMGKEFEDFHSTSSQAPGNVFLDNHWQYLENIWLCGGDVVKSNVVEYAASKGNAMAMSRVRKAVGGVAKANGSEIQDVATANYTRRGGSRVYETDPEEVRSGKMSTPVAASALAGAATGMCCHLTSGVFCGLEETNGATGIIGLYVAGDGIHATSPSGAAYPCGVGFTSCFTSIDGDHAGKAAADYASQEPFAEISEEQLAAKMEDLLAPMKRESGFDPNWARDVLHSIMAPYWVSVAKSDEPLHAAPVQEEYKPDHVVPKLQAGTGHDLRLCTEIRHKVLSAELKLRASLERKESRGNNFREDYPYRDDENYLCYITQRKTEDGQILAEKIPIPDAWAGDRNEAYQKRYVYYFPGEPEKVGFEAPKQRWGQKGGRK